MSNDQTIISESGQKIKIHGSEEFAAMRRAGLLAAEVLDFITPHVQAGVTTQELDKLCHDFILDHDAVPAPFKLSRLPKIHMHIGEPRRLPRHSWGEKASGRRYFKY